MTFRNLLPTLLCMVGLSACMGFFSSPSPPMVYGVDYPCAPVECRNGGGISVRIWPLSASSPFDRQEMIVVSPSRQVRSSTQFQWVTVPGDMLSHILLRDLSRSGIFAQVVPSGNPFNASLELSGHIHRFAWEDAQQTGRAILDVEITLWSRLPQKSILFRQHYHFESDPAQAHSPEQFALAMSKLVQRLSVQLGEELCGWVISTGNLSPAGG